MFSTVITTSVISAITSSVSTVSFRLFQPRPSSVGISASGRVATTEVTVRMPANK